MNALSDTQEQVNRFNEYAVWHPYRRYRVLRQLHDLSSPCSEYALDRLDWLNAERECREVQCVGRPHS
jgi:hypothetical protein